MSFDFSELKTKTEFNNDNSNPPPIVNLTEQELYDKKKNRIQKRILNFFNRTRIGNNMQLRIHTQFLNTSDKNDLITAIEGKGYACTEQNGIMIIS